MNKTWSNTALVAYSLLPKITGELDRAIISRVNSSFQSRHFKSGVSTEQLVEEINELIDEKRRIVNLRYIVDSALGNMDESARKLLRMRAIDKKTYADISKELGMSLRSVFRKLAEAEESYEKALKRMGMGEAFLESEYKDDPYIAPIHERLNDEKYCIAKNL